MVLATGEATVFTPLTAEVFGEDGGRVLHGTIEPVARPEEASTGLAFCVDGNRELFTHPDLLERVSREHGYAMFWFKVTLEDGQLTVREWPAHGPDPHGEVLYTAPPLELTPTTIDALMLFTRIIGRQEERCARDMGGECEGAGERELDPRRAVMVWWKGRERRSVLCAHCFKGLNDAEREYLIVEIDGRKLPLHGAVSIYA